MKYVKLPANIEYILTSCFEKCGIESLIIPNKVKTIAPTAFNNCSGLTNVTFGESLETIEDHAFQFTNISYLKFPDSLLFMKLTVSKKSKTGPSLWKVWEHLHLAVVVA